MDLVLVGYNQRAYEALTDLSAYALTLDSERLRLDSRLNELAEVDSSVEQRHALLRERDEISEELAALRATIAALREQIPH
jgi:chromosome segregation ATPase